MFTLKQKVNVPNLNTQPKDTAQPEGDSDKQKLRELPTAQEKAPEKPTAEQKIVTASDVERLQSFLEALIKAGFEKLSEKITEIASKIDAIIKNEKKKKTPPEEKPAEPQIEKPAEPQIEEQDPKNNEPKA